MTKLRALLIGILIGQALMVPHILRWMKYSQTPVIAAFPVSETIYREIGPTEHIIKDVRTNRITKPTPMRIVLMTVDAVQTKYKEIYGEDNTNLLGFYDYDRKNNEHIIYCANSPEIVIHEIRHAFEGSFHRSE